MQPARISRVGNLLGALAVAVDDLMGAASRDAALVVLDSHPGITVAGLSRALGRSHSATVRLLDGMVGSGLAERRAGDDARSRSLALTTAGLTAAAAVRDRRASGLDALLETLDGDQLGALEPILERLLEASAVDDADSRWRTCRLCDEPRCEEQRQCPVDRAAPR